jgi:hypothetical protein
MQGGVPTIGKNKSHLPGAADFTNPMQLQPAKIQRQA